MSQSLISKSGDVMTEQYNAACNLIEAGNLEQAFLQLRAILEQDEQHYPALNKLGVICANQQKCEAAKDYFHKALELNPDFVPALVNLGNLHMEDGDYRQAIETYNKAIERDADYCLAYYNMAIAYKKLGDYSKYIQNIKEYRKLYSKELKKHKSNFFGALSRRQA